MIEDEEKFLRYCDIFIKDEGRDAYSIILVENSFDAHNNDSKEQLKPMHYKKYVRLKIHLS